MSAAYIRYRILRPLLKAYYWIFKLFNPGSPWTSQASIIFFNEVLTKEMTGLEYGSGRSTFYFAKRLKHLVSIEHHTEWYNKVQNQLEKNNVNNVDYFLIPMQKHSENNEEEIELLDNLDGSERRSSFADYYNKVNEYNDGYFDFILIDGRVRVKCGINALPKLKSGGIFVLDNSERPRYALLHEALKEWPKVNTTSGLTNTTIWIKP